MKSLLPLIPLSVVILGAYLVAKAIRNPKIINTLAGTSERRCLACGYTGRMKTWLRGYSLPQITLLLLLFCMFIPGLIFWAWAWGKFKCPMCGALAKNVPSSFRA